MLRHSFNLGGFLTGIVFGGLVGGIVALFAAPRSGPETRQMLMEEGQHLKERAGKTLDTTRERMDAVLTDTRQRAGTIITDTRQRADDALQHLGEQVGPHQ